MPSCRARSLGFHTCSLNDSLRLFPVNFCSSWFLHWNLVLRISIHICIIMNESGFSLRFAFAFWPWRKTIYLAQTQHLSSPWEHPVFPSAGTGKPVRIEGMMVGAKYRDILEGNLFQSSRDLRLGRRFTFQQNNDPKHTAKVTLEWFKGSV